MKTERVRDWMGAPLVGCPVDVEMADVARLLWDEGIRHAPLLRKNGRVAGVLSDIDVFSAGTLVDDGVWVERVAREPRELARPARAIVHPDDELALGLAALRDAGSDYALVLEAEQEAVVTHQYDDGVVFQPGLFQPLAQPANAVVDR